MVDFSQMSFRKDFQPRNIQLVLDKGRTYLIAFESTFQNREWFNIRDIYEQYGEWCPGKGGIQVPLDMKQDLINAITALALKKAAA